MSTLHRGDIELAYTDHGGEGTPVVLVHGWPLSGASWGVLVPSLLAQGHRVITYDRRGFGASGFAGTDGYDYDLLADDLAALLDALDLHEVTLVGFSMGGGEVARYVGRHGQSRLRAVAFLAAIPPWLLLSEDNPHGGFDMASARQMQADLRADREAFLDGFLTTFFSVEGQLQVTEQQRADALGLAAQANLEAAVACIALWTSDFTADVAQITVPTLIVHGDSDAIVPVEVSGQRLHEQVSGSELHVVAGGPHGIVDSHTDEVRSRLLAFLSSH